MHFQGICNQFFIITLSVLLIQVTYHINAEVCKTQNPVELDQKLDALFSAFERGPRQLDLILLIDRSKSVTNATNIHMMEGVHALIDTLVSTSRLYLHPDFGRIALLSYGATITAEFEGISSEEHTFDSCEVESRIASLRTPADQETNTKVWQALERASQIFTARRSELSLEQNDNQHKQVLWTFYDGDANNEDAQDTEKVKEVVGVLTGEGVILFSAAIGQTPTGWLDTTEEENRVREVAKDSDHFACVETWTKLLREKMQEGSDSSADPVYAHVNSNAGLTPDRCVTCPQTCACDVIQREYSCVSCEHLGNCDNVTSSVTSSQVTAQASREQRLLRETWFVIVLAVVVSVMSCMVCSALVGLVCCCRSRNKKPSDAPPLPLPPKRYRQKELHIMSDPVYANTNSRPVSGLEPGEEFNWMEEELDMAKQQEQTLEEYHRNMPDWDRFLLTEASRSSLRHLAIYSLEHNASAWTPGFQLASTNVKTISRALGRKSLYKKPTIKIGNKSFLVDKDSVTPTKISGHSLNAGADPECLHVRREGKFLVVGVASTDKIDSCEKKVAEICEHLEAGPMDNLPVGGVSVEGGVVNKGILQETL